MIDIHSCGYYCDKPLCIKAQRDELRDKLFAKEWQGLTDEEIKDMGCDFATLGGDIDAKDWFAFYLAIEAKLKEKNSAT